MPFKKHSLYFPYVIAIFCSFALSAFILFMNPLINADGICYLQSAARMGDNINTAMHVCEQAKWPFYSWLLFWISHFTTLSLVNAAYLLNAFFSGSTVVLFMAIVQFLAKGEQAEKTRVVWLAALTLLLAHEFNALRHDIIRDHGFWSFYLLSLLFLLHFFKEKHWFSALGFGVSLLIATLFRIEASVFLVLLPFSLFFLKSKSLNELNKIKLYFRLISLPLIVAILLIFAWFILPHPPLVRLQEFKQQIIHSDTPISGFLSVKLLWAYINYILITMSFIYAALLLYALSYRRLFLFHFEKCVLASYIILNLMITVIWLAKFSYLSKRYLLGLSLVLMIWVPFALNALIKQPRKYPWVLQIVLVLIIISSAGGIVSFGYSKQYIYSASHWIKNNVPPQSTLYTNDLQLMYYSQHFDNKIFSYAKEFPTMQSFLVNKNINQSYDFIALKLAKKELIADQNYLKKLGDPLQVFSNNRGDQVRIYRRVE